MTRRFTKVATAGLLGVGAVAAANAAAAGTGNSEVIGSGPDYVYGTSALSGSTATVSAASIGDGNEQFTLDVTGIEAPEGTFFGAHVHQNPCGTTGAAAGPHYQHGDPSGDPLERKEVWLDFEVDDEGNGHAVATRNWSVTDRANRSVIIHALRTDRETGIAGARLVCIDLDA